jgi:molybdopterin molybdotransferase
MISFAAALELVGKRCAPITGAAPILLGHARSRILAETITAPIDVPASDNSAVDGYGFRYADLETVRADGLSVIGVAAAGRPFVRAIRSGETVRIFTGAILSPGIDAIAMQEDIVRSGDRIILRGHVLPEANIRRAGEDIARHAPVFASGRRLGPVELGMLASLGIDRIRVRLPLRVAVLSAGDELIDPGERQIPGAIYDANRPVLLALLRAMGMEATDFGILADDQAQIGAALRRAAAGHDAIVTSAGVSVGDEDHLRGAVETFGGVDFASVAIKPGKPFAFGHIAGTPFFGLPGNPVAMVLTFLMLARPGLLRLAGASSRPPMRFPVESDFVLRRRPGRREFLRCRLRDGPDGPVATRFSRGGSGILSSVADSDGLLELVEDLVEIAPGMRLPFIPFSELGLIGA